MSSPHETPTPHQVEPSYSEGALRLAAPPAAVRRIPGRHRAAARGPGLPAPQAVILEELTSQERERFQAWFAALAPEAADLFLTLAEDKTSVCTPPHAESLESVSLVVPYLRCTTG